MKLADWMRYEEPDGLRPETKVRHGLGAGLLGVVDEVALNVDCGILADDLDAVLVGADRAVRAEAEEHRSHHPIGFGDEGGIVDEAGVRRRRR